MSYHKLLEIIEEYKEKITDKEYKDTLECVSSLKKEYEEMKEKDKNHKNEINKIIKRFDYLKNKYITLSIRYIDIDKAYNGNIYDEEDEEENTFNINYSIEFNNISDLLNN